MHSNTRILAVSLIFLLAFVAIAVRPGGAAAASGEISGSLPTTGGIGLAVWGGGSIDVFQTAASARGCSVSAAWVTSASSPSGFIGYVRGAPTVVNAEFNAAFPGSIPATTVLIVRCEATGAGPAGLPTPAATASPTSTPPSGAPSSLIGISGDLLPESATTFAMNITRINTLGAVALPRENSEVTYVRLCRWSNSTSPVCTSEVAPTLDVFTERGTSYLINLPSAGGRVTISTQLCNIRGCGDHVFWGTAGMARDGSFSFVATTYSTVSRVRPYVNTPSIARMTVTYSDGLVGTDNTCRGAGVCATNAYDPTPLGRVATIVSRGLEGNVLLSESVILRASQDARTSQVPDRLPRARDASLSQTPPVAATLVSTGQGSDGRLSFPITAPQSLSVLDVRTFSEVSAAIPTGASVKLTMNGAVLPPRTNVLLAVIADLSSLAAQAPPPAGSSFVFGVTTSAVNANGAVTPTGQVRGVWIVPGSMMAPDTVAADLSLAYWDGAGWVTVSDGTTSNSGSFVVDSWLSKLGTFVVLRRAPA